MSILSNSRFYKIDIKYIYIKSTPVISKPDITKYPLIAKCDIFPRVLNAYIFISLQRRGEASLNLLGGL